MDKGGIVKLDIWASFPCILPHVSKIRTELSRGVEDFFKLVDLSRWHIIWYPLRDSLRIGSSVSAAVIHHRTENGKVSINKGYVLLLPLCPIILYVLEDVY